LRHTRKSVRMGYDVRENEEERKTKAEKLKNRKSRDERRNEHRSQYHLRLYAAFAATRRYISPSVGFLLSISFPSLACQSFWLLFLPRLQHRSPSRRMFVPTALYHPAIISHTCHSPSVSPLPSSVIPPTLTHYPSFSRHYHAASCKIYVCRRAGDVAAGYLFF